VKSGQKLKEQRDCIFIPVFLPQEKVKNMKDKIGIKVQEMNS
jgi:hypothetical protein